MPPSGPVAAMAGFDGVLVDAPCTSTGTIRRHPDVAWLRQEADIAALAALQKRLLQRAVALLKPGGTLVYCTCSLEPEEGEQAIASLLAAESGMRRAPIEAGEVAGLSEIVTADGDLRTLPCHLPQPTPGSAGWTGFTPRGWLNPDFTPQFPDVRVIRACSRWCHGGVSGLKGFARITLPPSIKARRVGRSTQTHLDAYHGPLGAERDRACERRRRWRCRGCGPAAPTG